MNRFAVVSLFSLASLQLASVAPAYAHDSFVSLVPRTATAMNSVGTERPCITCHNNPDGGAGCVNGGGTKPCLNPFGEAFRDASRFWDEDLAALDSDADGFTNGQELQDPLGTWRLGQSAPGVAEQVTRPGFVSSSPGLTDGDGDGYCWFGRDMNGNGVCVDAGENDGSFDCNDNASAINSGQSEVCTNEADNDCDGLSTLVDPECGDVVDQDGDGVCLAGRDNNGDRDCIDPGENTGEVDCDPAQITVYPGAPENCVDGLDNDCDDATDGSDSDCRTDVDNDDDGFCPLGADLNNNGRCDDNSAEVGGGHDCDDNNPDANPRQVEICTDAIDNDCNGLANFTDPTCRPLLDADADGYCPMGRDVNNDQDCADETEDDGSVDCNDEDETVNPGAMEMCLNGRDDDCDGQISLSDEDCFGYLDVDRDRYCFVGFDFDRNGTCTGEGEQEGTSDCDDGSARVNPEAMEVCTDGVDNNCDGSEDAYDPICSAEYLDFDRDGWCEVGQDISADGDCSDEGEQEGPADAAKDDPTIFPGAGENCFDRKDNDQDGTIDLDDSDCTRERDEDGDGYCKIGQDMNGDGDCTDDNENIGVSDCQDDNPDVRPGAEELCTDFVDNDCDGDVDLVDDACWFLLDLDRDGFCGMGIDDNRDGDCLDASEDRFGEDCDDSNPEVSPRVREVCDDGIDNDCDGNIDVDDTQCPCENDAQCDDGDDCTVDRCDDEGQGCLRTPDPMCGDGGMGDGGGGGGCGCAVPGASRVVPGGTPGGSSSNVWIVLALAGGWWLRRKRRRTRKGASGSGRAPSVERRGRTKGRRT